MKDEKLLLYLSDVSKIYRMDGLEVKALDDISLTIGKEEFVSIMGPSGSGKSTLMYLLGCLDKPTEGKVILDGRDTSGLSESELAKIRNEKIGFVFQMFNLLPRTSALANIQLPLIYTKVSYKERNERAFSLLERLGLFQRKQHYPSQLSGGEQQRVAIARALITNPLLILADEPTGNVDSKSGKEIMEIFRQLNKEGKTVIVVTHDKEVAKYAGRIIKIKDGRII